MEGQRYETTNLRICEKHSERSGARFNHASKRRSLISIERIEINHQITNYEGPSPLIWVRCIRRVSAGLNASR